jgi:polysaccharide export outer membrane protein
MLKTFKYDGLPSFLLITMLLSGCAGYLPGAGPDTKKVHELAQQPAAAIAVVSVDAQVNSKLQQQFRQQQFAEIFAKSKTPRYQIGKGDILEVSIWEAPPASLFGGAISETRNAVGGARATTLPDQMVSHQGNIRIPFVGAISVLGKTQADIEWLITEKLKHKANQPQVMVRLKSNNSSNVTVVGEVTSSKLIPLSSKGERLLDALALSGGVRQPVNKITVQLTRDQQVASMPLEDIIRDPRQNVTLQTGDVVTALHAPLSLTVLGATGKNEELNFEVQGISLVQALARAGGLQDNRADKQGVFLFRFEDVSVASALGLTQTANAEGKVPVVYRLDMSDPAVFFHAQNFRMQDKDVLYVSNASAAELQKFLNVLLSAFYPLLNAVSVTR